VQKPKHLETKKLFYHDGERCTISVAFEIIRFAFSADFAAQHAYIRVATERPTPANQREGTRVSLLLIEWRPS
jgi:hypothetical protein